jgi:hypothetical protein
MHQLVSLLTVFLIFSCATHSKKVENTVSTGPKYRGDIDFHPRSKDPAFKVSGPKVCFDEGHNNLAVDKGFYKPVWELIESDGYKLVHKKESFTLANLQECRILYVSAVLGYPKYDTKENKKLAKRSAFSNAEISAISKWVHNGGSLLLMTDHKPMGTAAGKLLAEFKVYGSDTNVRNAKHPVAPFQEDGIFSIPTSQMNWESPIIRGRNESERLKEIYFFYGQALKGPKQSDVFLKTGSDALIGGQYDEPVLNPDEFPAAALALKVGKGRLVVFGDATVFTSKMDLHLNEPTGINRPGSSNIQMALNVFHWLSGILN